MLNDRKDHSQQIVNYFTNSSFRTMASNPEMTLQVKQRCIPVKKAGQTNRLLTPEMSGDHWKRLFNFSSEITVKTNDLKLKWIKTNIENADSC